MGLRQLSPVLVLLSSLLGSGGGDYAQGPKGRYGTEGTSGLQRNTKPSES